MTPLESLYAKLAAVAPIVGVSVGNLDNKATWRVDFADGVTEEQQTAAAVVLDAFDMSAPFVPPSVTPRQARAALNAAGLRAAVEAAVAAASQDVRDAWEYGLAVERCSPFIAAIAGALELADAQIDALFVAAAQA